MAAPATRKDLLPAASSLLAAGGAVLVLRHGLVMGPDSWAYWEGSVSLLERGAYTYFGGQRVYVFPPLFALWLAAVQAVLGVSVRSLAIAQALCAGTAAWHWVRLYAAAAGDARTRATDALAAVAIALPLAVSAQTLLSESLWLALLPLALRLADRTLLGRTALNAPALALVTAALLLCRNLTVAFLPALVAYAALRAPEARIRRAAVVAAAFVPSLAVWMEVRRALDQTTVHPFGGGAGLVAAASGTAAGLAESLGPVRAGVGALLLTGFALLCAMLAARASRETVPARALAAFGALGLAGQAALFAATYVAEPIRGRFLVFAALLAPIVSLAASAGPGLVGRAGWLLGAALAAVSVLRFGQKVRLAGVEQATLPIHTTVTSSYWNGPSVTRGGQVLAAPPTYPWLTRPDGRASAP